MKVGIGVFGSRLPGLGNDESSCPDSVRKKRNHYGIELRTDILRVTFVGPSARELGRCCYAHAFKYFHVVKMPQCQRSTEKQASRCVSLLDLASSTRMC